MSRNQYLKRILVAPLGDKVVLVAIIERFSGARPSTTLAESACTGVLWICFLQCGHCSGGGKVTGGNAQPTSRRFDFTNDCAVQLMGRSLCARLVLNKGRPQLNSGSDFRRCNQPMPRHHASKGGARTDDIMRHQSIHAWTRAMWNAGSPLPTQQASGRARCFSGAAIDNGTMHKHVYTAYRRTIESCAKPLKTRPSRVPA
jgi:hypothetical protein